MTYGYPPYQTTTWTNSTTATFQYDTDQLWTNLKVDDFSAKLREIPDRIWQGLVEYKKRSSLTSRHSTRHDHGFRGVKFRLAR